MVVSINLFAIVGCHHIKIKNLNEHDVVCNSYDCLTPHCQAFYRRCHRTLSQFGRMFWIKSKISHHCVRMKFNHLFWGGNSTCGSFEFLNRNYKSNHRVRWCIILWSRAFHNKTPNHCRSFNPFFKVVCIEMYGCVEEITSLSGVTFKFIWIWMNNCKVRLDLWIEWSEYYFFTHDLRL